MSGQDDPFLFNKWIVDSFHEASLKIVKNAIKVLSKEQKLVGHAFYIAFATQYKGVKITDKLKEQYPEKMTIVLEHQFDNLVADNRGFAVTIYINSAPYELYVPYKSILSFHDAVTEITFVLADMPSKLVDNKKSSRYTSGKEQVDNIIEFKRH